MDAKLCAGSEFDAVEPGQVNGKPHTCAGSTAHTSEPGCSKVSVDVVPSNHLTRRQKKRAGAVKRKKRLFSKAFEMEDKMNEHSRILTVAEKEIDSLRVQKSLYQAKLSRKMKEVSTLKSEIARKEKSGSQSLRLSYGFRLLQTASGNRSLLQSSDVKFDSSKINRIPEMCITGTDEMEIIGEGRFGKCTVVRFHDYKACMKSMKSVDTAQVLREAYFISEAGGHRSIPHLFGVTVSMNAIIMSYHTVNGNPLSMYDAIGKNSYNEEDWICHLISTANVLLHLKEKKILHNDIKLDNFIFGTSCESTTTPVLVDFGKACFITQAKSYSLSSSEINTYKLHHPHLSPDLRDGRCKQSFSSDIYSFGYLLNNLIKKKVLSIKGSLVESISKECMHYCQHDRPDIEDVIQCLTNIM